MTKTITKIEQQKHRPHRFSIFLNDRFWLGTDEETIAKLNLQVGRTIEEDETEKIIFEAEKKKAMDKALTLLSARSRSVYEVTGALERKGFAPEIIENVTTKLLEQGYLNDMEFVKSWIRNRNAVKPMGRYRIVQELRQKGIEGDIVEAGLAAQLGPELEERQALEMAKHLMDKKGTTNEAKQKIAGTLLRRGYSYAIVKKALQLAPDYED